MDQETFSEYLNAIEIIEANERLAMIEAASFPSYKKEHQERLSRNLKNKASGGVKKKANLTLDQVMGIVNG